jgi:hypothetical protein
MKHNNFKQRVLTFALAAVFAIGSGFFAVNSYAADGTGTATATVVIPIAIAASSPDLLFGSFSTTAADQTIEIATAGTRTLTGALGLGTAQNSFGAASFAVTGEGTLTYAITLPDDVTVTIETGEGTTGETMAVSSFVSDPTPTGTLTGGAQTLKVGATITTIDSQVTGEYTGTFDVTVEYN